MGSGGIILSYKNGHRNHCADIPNIQDVKDIEKTQISKCSEKSLTTLTRIHVGRRGYDPVVRTSMAKGIAKLGKRACTRASLASDASLSAVSTNRMVC